MPNLTIKQIPEGLHRQLKKAAWEEGKSLNSYVVGVLEESAEQRRLRRRMKERWPEFEKFLSTLPRFDDNAALIREDRDQR